MLGSPDSDKIRLRRSRKVRQNRRRPIYQGVSLRMQALAKPCRRQIRLRRPRKVRQNRRTTAKTAAAALLSERHLRAQSCRCSEALPAAKSRRHSVLSGRLPARKSCHRSETPPSANPPPPPPRGPTYPPPQAPRGRPVKPLRHFSGKYRSFVRFPTRQALKRGPLSIIIGIVSTFKGFCEKPGARVFRQALGDGYFLG